MPDASDREGPNRRNWASSGLGFDGKSTVSVGPEYSQVTCFRPDRPQGKSSLGFWFQSTLLGMGSGMQFCLARYSRERSHGNMGQFCDFRNERGYAVGFGNEGVNAGHFVSRNVGCA